MSITLSMSIFLYAIPITILWSQSKQRNEVADAKPVVLTLKVKFFKTKIVILILS